MNNSIILKYWDLSISALSKSILNHENWRTEYSADNTWYPKSSCVHNPLSLKNATNNDNLLIGRKKKNFIAQVQNTEYQYTKDS